MPGDSPGGDPALAGAQDDSLAALQRAQAAQGDAVLDILMGCIRQPGSIVQDRPCYVEPCNYVVQPFGLHHPDHPLLASRSEMGLSAVATQ